MRGGLHAKMARMKVSPNEGRMCAYNVMQKMLNIGKEAFAEGKYMQKCHNEG